MKFPLRIHLPSKWVDKDPFIIDSFPDEVNNESSIKFTYSRLIKKTRKIPSPLLRSNYSHGHDLITGKILRKLPDLVRLATLSTFNAILHYNYFPSDWKHARIIVIPKPGK